MMQEEFLTVAEAAERFHIEDWRIRQWIKAGKLPTYEREYDKKIRLKPEDVQRVVISINTIVPRGE